jgi:amidohydrolase
MDYPLSMNEIKINHLFPGLIEYITDLRRDLHRIPEIALEEFKTRDRLMKELEDLPLAFHKPYLGTDIVADLIPEETDGKIIIFRADMDGLKITEEGEWEWKSTHPGKMHACGHDGHMAILVGTVKLLCQLKEKLSSTIRFVFQPGEEMLCAGHMLADAGAYDGATEAYGLHGWPGIGQGVIKTKAGVFMAATDSFYFTFTGKGSHGATPENGRNPLLPASRFVLGAVELHEKYNNSWGSVISPCIIKGGSSSNIIPEKCYVSGTTRYLDKEQGKLIQDELTALAEKLASKGECKLQIQYDRLYYLPVINDSKKADLVLSLAEDLFGTDNAMRAEKHDMMAEDFAFCLDKTGGCFFHLGLGENWPGLHTPKFDFNDPVIERGITLFTALAGGFDE